MDNLRKIKEITYSSEYVADLERKLEHLKEENTELKHDKWLRDCTASYYLEVYKQALKQAIRDADACDVCFADIIVNSHEESALFEECTSKVGSHIENIAEFYFRLACKQKDKEEWSKRK